MGSHHPHLVRVVLKCGSDLPHLSRSLSPSSSPLARLWKGGSSQMIPHVVNVLNSDSGVFERVSVLCGPGGTGGISTVSL